LRKIANMNGQIEKIVEFIVNSNRIVVFVGAGLSTESGIPDFRSPGGVWDRYDPQDFSKGSPHFLNSNYEKWKLWKNRISNDMLLSFKS
jgi:NAD-dependent deacetylase